MGAPKYQIADVSKTAFHLWLAHLSAVCDRPCRGGGSPGGQEWVRHSGPSRVSGGSHGGDASQRTGRRGLEFMRSHVGSEATFRVVRPLSCSPRGCRQTTVFEGP